MGYISMIYISLTLFLFTRRFVVYFLFRRKGTPSNCYNTAVDREKVVSAIEFSLLWNYLNPSPAKPFNIKEVLCLP